MLKRETILLEARAVEAEGEARCIGFEVFCLKHKVEELEKANGALKAKVDKLEPLEESARMKLGYVAENIESTINNLNVVIQNIRRP